MPLAQVVVNVNSRIEYCSRPTGVGLEHFSSPFYSINQSLGSVNQIGSWRAQESQANAVVKRKLSYRAAQDSILGLEPFPPPFFRQYRPKADFSRCKNESSVTVKK